MTAYYNEIDPYAAQWLRNLIDAGLIAPGYVDSRSITEVTPNDLKGFTQCHFFAGIGIWSHALRSAGWDDRRSVWTGSCPCQPFSQAGKGKGKEDDRHLWPAWYELIKKCKPDVVFGEQVSSKVALAWLDDVQNNLESSGYAFGALDLCAAGIGAPHIRQRLFWVADTISQRCERLQESGSYSQGKSPKKMFHIFKVTRLCNTSSFRMANAVSIRQPGQCWSRKNRITKHSKTGRMADTKFEQCQRGLQGQKQELSTYKVREAGQSSRCSSIDGASPTNGFWRAADWLYCADGKWRPVRSGSFPLVNGDPNRVGRLRAYGNAINAEVAKTFIESYIEIDKEK